MEFAHPVADAASGLDSVLICTSFLGVLLPSGRDLGGDDCSAISQFIPPRTIHQRAVGC